MSEADFYHGCIHTEGHFLWGANGITSTRTIPPDFPVPLSTLDCGLLPPREEQAEGSAVLVHINGWTVVAFWDRSVDSRPGSNSAFVFRGVYDFGSACCRAKAKFPDVWKRFTFPVVQRV